MKRPARLELRRIWHDGPGISGEYVATGSSPALAKKFLLYAETSLDKRLLLLCGDQTDGMLDDGRGRGGHLSIKVGGKVIS